MRFSVNYRDLTADQKQRTQLATVTVREIKKVVRAVSFAVERLVKDEMPVDTGRARASWGHWTPGSLKKEKVTSSAGGTEYLHLSNATAEDAYWEVTDDGFTIEQGSNVEYIDALNEGHSSKAPAGFLDKAEKKGNQELEVEIDKIIDRYW